MNKHYYILPDLLTLSQIVAEQLVQLIHQKLKRQKQFLLVLSGGNTPQLLYDLLTTPPFVSEIPWPQIHFFWGDERCVSPDQLGSNFNQVQKALFSKIPSIPTNHVHRIQGELLPHQAAQKYTHKLKQFASPNHMFPSFDLVLLGMGTDGHTASLFPNQFSGSELTNIVSTTTAYYEERPSQRITLTPMILNASQNVWFLVSGPSKAQILAQILSPSTEQNDLPAQRILPDKGELCWFLTQDAAQHLPQTISQSCTYH